MRAGNSSDSDLAITQPKELHIPSFRQAFPWLLAILLLSLFAVLSRGITSTADTRVFLGPDSAGVQELRKFEEDFGRRSTLHFAVSQGSAFREDYLPVKALAALESKLWRLDYVTSVVSAVSTDHPIASDDGIDVVPTQEMEDGAERDAVLKRGSVNQILVTPDREWWSVVAEVDLPEGLPGEVVKLDQELLEIVSDVQSGHPDLKIDYTSEIALMAEFAKSAAKDNSTLVPAALVVIFLVFALSIQSWRVFLVLLVLLLLSISFSLALRSMFGGATNTATAIIPLIVLVVVAANSMHYFWAVLFRSRIAHKTAASLVISARDEYALPLAISGFSTAGGFFLLLFASSPPFIEMGWVMGCTLTFSTVMLLYWVPAALSSFGIKKIGMNSRLVAEMASRLFLIGRHPIVSTGFIGLILTALLGLSFLEINDDFTSYFPEDSRFTKSTKAVESRFGGPDYIEVVQLVGNQSGGSSAAEILGETRELTRWLRARPEIVSVVSLSDSVDELVGALGATPDANLEEILLVYEMGLPIGQEVSSRITSDRRKVRTTGVLGDIDSSGILELRRELLAYRGEGLTVTGISVPTSSMAYENTKDVLVGVLFAGLFVAFLMLILYQDFRVAALVFLFVALPIAVGFGVWGWLFGDVGLATAAVLAASVGVVVDDVVHVVYRYVRVKGGSGDKSEAALIQVMKEVAPPIFISSLAIAFGFGLLVISDFGVNNALGLSVSIIVLFALLTVLLLLPKYLDYAARS